MNNREYNNFLEDYFKSKKMLERRLKCIKDNTELLKEIKDFFEGDFKTKILKRIKENEEFLERFGYNNKQ